MTARRLPTYDAKERQLINEIKHTLLDALVRHEWTDAIIEKIATDVQDNLVGAHAR